MVSAEGHHETVTPFIICGPTGHVWLTELWVLSHLRRVARP